MKNQVQQLLDAGQSVWIDNLRRSMFASGELQRLIDKRLARHDQQPDDLREGDRRRQRLRRAARDADRLGEERRRAVLGSRDPRYSERLRRVRTGLRLLERQRRLRQPRGLAAARQRHRRHDRDGRGALEAREPSERHDQDPRHEGRACRQSKSRSTADTTSTSRSIFSVEMYERAARAYVKGLGAARRRGQADRQDPLGQLRLRQPNRHRDRQAAARPHRQGRKARASARQDGHRRPQADLSKVQGDLPTATSSRRCKAKGAAVQRPLWASTSTKNPHYPDLMYVENVVGPRHGQHDAAANARRAARSRQDRSRHGRERSARCRRRHARAAGREDLALRRDASAAGRRRHALLRFVRGAARRDRLQAKTARSRAAPNACGSALERLAARVRRGARAPGDGRFPQAHLGARCDAMVERPRGRRRSSRSRWAGSTSSSTCSKRFPGSSRLRTRRSESFGFAVVCGMGGSSLAPDILADTFGSVRRLSASCTSSTRPVRSRSKSSKGKIHIPHTLFIISSKSGTTTEPNAFYCLLPREGLEAGRLGRGGTKLRRDHRPRNHTGQGGARGDRSAPTSRTIPTSAAATRRSRSSASRRPPSPATTSTCCSTARSARCTPTIAASIRAARPGVRFGAAIGGLAGQRPR